MSAHPDRIFVTVNGVSTRLPDGRRQLIGGWSEDASRPGAAEYVRASHLTSAAPDLYERLEASTKTLILERDVYYECHSLADGTVPDDDDRAQLENLDAVIAANQAALARARGEA